MKNVAIFGAGSIGKLVLDILGKDLVSFFISNNPAEVSIDGISVIRFEEYLKYRDDVYVMVASTKYAEEMKKQLQASGIQNFFVWNNELLRFYSNYSEDGFEVALSARYNPVYSGQDWSSITYPLVRAFLKHDICEFKSLCIYAYTETISMLIELIRMVGKSDDVVSIIHCGECEKSIINSIIDKVDCVICAVEREDNEICDIYEHNRNVNVIDLYDIAKFVPQARSEKAQKYKNRYKGRRCFIIGNGPSLSIDDLNKIEANGDISFACNKIYKIFPNTTWRPDFYFLVDVWVLKSDAKEILNIEPKECCFYNYGFCNGYILWNDNEKVIPLYHMPEQNSTARLTRFSKDISIHHCIGASVTYTMLQAAYYMGFESVYLIGCDHFVESLEKSKEIKHFYDNSGEVVWDLTPQYTKIDNHIKLNKDYQSAKLVFEESGRHVYNATRGGFLEVFERVEFDSLFDRGLE